MTSPWSSQTAIGDKFGISCITVGKILLANGLKHPNTNKPTAYAFQNGFAIKSYGNHINTGPLWNSDKIELIINKSHPYLSRDELYVYRIESELKQQRYKSIRNDYKQLYQTIKITYYVPKDISYAKMVVMLNAAMKLEKRNVRNAICAIIANIDLSPTAVEELKVAVKMHYPEHIEVIDKVLLLK